MAIELNDNVDILAPKAPDARMYVADSTARDAIDANYRWPGMIVYVDDVKQWQYLDLQDGDDLSSNAAWVALGGGSTPDLQAVLTEGAIYSGSDYIEITSTSSFNVSGSAISLSAGNGVFDSVSMIKDFSQIAVADARILLLYQAGIGSTIQEVRLEDTFSDITYDANGSTNRRIVRLASADIQFMAGSQGLESILSHDISNISGSTTRTVTWGDYDYNLSGGTNTQVLTRTASGAEWQDAAGGGGTPDFEAVLTEGNTSGPNDIFITDLAEIELRDTTNTQNTLKIGRAGGGTNERARITFQESDTGVINSDIGTIIELGKIETTDEFGGNIYTRYDRPWQIEVEDRDGGATSLILDFRNVIGKGTNRTVLVPHEDGTLLLDAPSDNTIYGRQNGSWVAVGAGGGGTPNLSDVLTEGNTAANDLELTGSANGIILESPDSTRWRITVDNSGNLITTSI